jgi:hypothetical protein
VQILAIADALEKIDQDRVASYVLGLQQVPREGGKEGGKEGGEGRDESDDGRAKSILGLSPDHA